MEICNCTTNQFLFRTLKGIQWFHVLLCSKSRKKIESIPFHQTNFRMNGFHTKNFEEKSCAHTYHIQYERMAIMGHIDAHEQM